MVHRLSGRSFQLAEYLERSSIGLPLLLGAIRFLLKVIKVQREMRLSIEAANVNREQVADQSEEQRLPPMACFWQGPGKVVQQSLLPLLHPESHAHRCLD